MTEDFDQLYQEIERLQTEVTRLKEIIRNAKDTTPVQRVTYHRVLRLAREACMDLVKEGKKWILKMGNLTREFKTLRQIWEVLIQDDWILSDIFKQSDPVRTQKQKLCKFCSNPIHWSKNFLNRWVPFNLDGTKHRCLFNSG